MTQSDDVTHPIHIIDTDAHLTEPPDLWSSRVPASMAGRMPVQKTVDGLSAWYLGDEVWANIGGNTILHGAEKLHGTLVAQPFQNIDPSAYAVKERLELLDSLGIFAEILYPNGIGFASNHVFAIDDEQVRRTVLEVYNDFLVEAQQESNGRLFPQALLPVWDMELTVREMTRLLGAGIRGFTLSDKPEMIGLPELDQPYFAPMWDLFNESGAVANFHIGAGARREDIQAIKDPSKVKGGPNGSTVLPSWTSFSRQRRYVVNSVQTSMSNMRIISNLIMSDLFDRYPKLKIVSAESGIGWVPFLLEFIEFLYDEMITQENDVRFAKRRPTEYFRDHIYVMFWFEELGPQRLIDAIGHKNVMVETDIPHPACFYPGPREQFERVLSGQPPEVVRDILQDNAAALYNIPVPSPRGA